MAKSMGLEAFLGHSSKRTMGSSRLGNWKKRDSKAVNTVLHTRAPLTALWQHQIPRIEVVERDGANKREVWGGTWNCLEDEEVLSKQYFRDDDDEREAPPTVCPLCILIEVVRSMVREGTLKLTDPILRWKGDEDERTIHAGGIYNAFNNKNLGSREKKAMKVAGIRASEAWRQNVYAKCNYLFVVVDVDHPDDGVQWTIETTLLGDKVKEQIRDRMTAMGVDEGNPLKNPVVIRWIHQPDEKEFGKKYKALVMPKIALSAEVRRLVHESEPPDVANITRFGNISSLRARLEEAAVIELPWDDIFGPAERLASESGEIEDDEDDAPPAAESVPEVADDSEPESVPEPDSVPPPDPSVPEAEASEPADDVEMFDCDKCGGEMREDEFTCPHCGAEYDPETGELKPTPPPKEKRTRSAAKAKGTKAKAKGSGGSRAKGGGKAAPPPAKPSSSGDDWPDDDPDDDIPF